ncbi:MAG: hypothetical protein ACI30K_04710 [Muribaculaceae bacterium]
METKAPNNDIDQMRAQLESLRQSLDHQEIVNERLIAKSMKSRMSWLKKYIIMEACLIPVIAILWLELKMALGLSWLNYAFLMVMVVIDVYIDYLINLHGLSDADYSKDNLIATVSKLVVMKRRRTIQMVVTVPLVIVWVLWTGLEAYASLATTAEPMLRAFIFGALIGCAIGGVAGLIFAFYIYRKMQRTNDDVISQINEYTTESND